MASPLEISRGAGRLAAVALLVLVAPSPGCDKKQDAPSPAASPASTAADGSAAKLRCQDFISKDEAKALGLRAELYNDRAKAPMDGVHCTLGEVSAQIWRGNQYTSIVDGISAHGGKDGVVMEDGPKIGAETQWTTMPGVHGMDGKPPHTANFLAANQKFTAAVTGTDQAKVEQVARALLAKFEAKVRGEVAPPRR